MDLRDWSYRLDARYEELQCMGPFFMDNIRTAFRKSRSKLDMEALAYSLSLEMEEGKIESQKVFRTCIM